MNKLVNRLLLLYRPLYLRGLLMDGQYRLPQAPTSAPPKSKKRVPPIPAFKRSHRQGWGAAAAAEVVTWCVGSTVNDPFDTSSDSVPTTSSQRPVPATAIARLRDL